MALMKTRMMRLCRIYKHYFLQIKETAESCLFIFTEWSFPKLRYVWGIVEKTIKLGDYNFTKN